VHTVIFRSIGEADLPRVITLIAPDPASTLTADRFMARLASREYRPEWTWVAEDTASPSPFCAAAVWWGEPRGSKAETLDGIFVREAPGQAGRRAAIATALLTAAHAVYTSAGTTGAGTAEPPPFHVFLPGGGRPFGRAGGQPGTAAVRVGATRWLARRAAAADRAGRT
jgi:hypothetical protein